MTVNQKIDRLVNLYRARIRKGDLYLPKGCILVVRENGPGMMVCEVELTGSNDPVRVVAKHSLPAST